MFTIDLLQGEGRPSSGDPGRVALAMVAIAIPLFVFFGLVLYYFYTCKQLTGETKQLSHLKVQVAGLADLRKKQEKLEERVGESNRCLQEVAEVLPRCAQWSGILQSIAQNIPDALVVRELEVKRGQVHIEVPRKDNPKKKITIGVPRRTLRVSVYDHSDPGNDEAVQQLIQCLRAEPLFMSQMEDIRLRAHQLDRVGNQRLNRYEIDCVLKTPI